MDLEAAEPFSAELPLAEDEAAAPEPEPEPPALAPEIAPELALEVEEADPEAETIAFVGVENP